MRFRCIMRYYHPFPDVIPHTRAGCSRVTHPSATDQGPKSRHRSTWMCYARRQRSSWARIKLSNKLYIFHRSGQILVWAIYLSFLYFFRVVFSLVLTDFCIRTCFFNFALYFYLLLFNCQVSIARFARAGLLYHIFSLLSIPFLKFL